jgi:hypothetical protein
MIYLIEEYEENPKIIIKNNIYYCIINEEVKIIETKMNKVKKFKNKDNYESNNNFMKNLKSLKEIIENYTINNMKIEKDKEKKTLSLSSEETNNKINIKVEEKQIKTLTEKKIKDIIFLHQNKDIKINKEELIKIKFIHYEKNEKDLEIIKENILEYYKEYFGNIKQSDLELKDSKLTNLYQENFLISNFNNSYILEYIPMRVYSYFRNFFTFLINFIGSNKDQNRVNITSFGGSISEFILFHEIQKKMEDIYLTLELIDIGRWKIKEKFKDIHENFIIKENNQNIQDFEMEETIKISKKSNISTFFYIIHELYSPFELNFEKINIFLDTYFKYLEKGSIVIFTDSFDTKHNFITIKKIKSILDISSKNNLVPVYMNRNCFNYFSKFDFEWINHDSFVRSLFSLNFDLNGKSLKLETNFFILIFLKI